MRKKLTMQRSNSITFERGFEEYISNCKARNLREGTLNIITIVLRHYINL